MNGGIIPVRITTGSVGKEHPQSDRGHSARAMRPRAWWQRPRLPFAGVASHLRYQLVCLRPVRATGGGRSIGPFSPHRSARSLRRLVRGCSRRAGAGKWRQRPRGLKTPSRTSAASRPSIVAGGEYTVSAIDEFSLTTIPIDLRFNEQPLSSSTAFTWERDDLHYLITNWHIVSGRDPNTDKHLLATAAEPNLLYGWFNTKGNNI